LLRIPVNRTSARSSINKSKGTMSARHKPAGAVKKHPSSPATKKTLSFSQARPDEKSPSKATKCSPTKSPMGNPSKTKKRAPEKSANSKKDSEIAETQKNEGRSLHAPMT